MGKPFFEVFPTLKLKEEIRDIMGQATVEKISATRRRDYLRVYLFSTRLIVKDNIRETESEIKRQLFPNVNIRIKIYERFELSSQYNPEKLLNIYRESILSELKEYSHVEYTAFKTADISFPGRDKVLLTVEDSVLTRSKEEELIRVLEKVLVERCGFQVSVQVAYKEGQTGKYQEEDELRLRMRVDEICRRVRGGTLSDGEKEPYF